MQHLAKKVHITSHPLVLPRGLAINTPPIIEWWYHTYVAFVCSRMDNRESYGSKQGHSSTTGSRYDTPKNACVVEQKSNKSIIWIHLLYFKSFGNKQQPPVKPST